MPIAQPYSVVTQGLGGGLYVTQGYAVGDIGITIDPVVGVTAALGTIVYTASVAASWSVTGGSIVAAGDNLSATWTAPAGVGTYTITGTDLSNPGNIGHAYGVVQAAGIVGGSFTFAGGTGNLIDTARTGTYGVVASGGGGGSPVLLDGLIGWALTGGPQQTLSSAGVVASGPLDLTVNGSPTYGSSGWQSPTGSDYLYFDDPTGDSLGAGKTDPWLWTFRCKTPDLSSASIAGVAPVFGNPYIVQASPTLAYGAGQSGIQNNQAESSIAPTPLVNNITADVFHVIFGWYDPNAGLVWFQVDDNTPVSRDVSLDFTPGWTLTKGAVSFNPFVNAGTTASQMYLRGWFGANALTIASNATYRAFLATGPSDAALAAYTGA